MRKEIVIADDHELFATGLRHMLAACPEFQLNGYFKNGFEFLDFIRMGNRPDLLILDLEMPLMDGYEVLEFLNDNKIKIKKLVVSMHLSVASIEKSKILGADGFISKTVSLSFLMYVIKTLLSGNSFFQDPEAKSILDLDIEFCRKLTSRFHLTKREIQILNLTKSQLSCTEIATLLNLSILTVKTHRRNILKKLSLKSFVGLADLMEDRHGY